MTDFFLLLGEPRRPWLDSEALKKKFHSLSTDLHPDRVHALGNSERELAQARYTELNSAYQCLRDSKERLRHLLDLELGPRPKQVRQIPTDLMDVSLEIGNACREADAFAAAQARITSPLLKAQSFERGHELTTRVEALRQKINEQSSELDRRVRAIDQSWENSTANRAEVLSELESISHLYGYYGRWTTQLGERLVRMIS